VGKKGDGIARYQGLVIFVPGTSTGQHVRVRILNVARTFAMAEKIG
jgi:predicted RNA-binding protein with TRAM domain